MVNIKNSLLGCLLISATISAAAILPSHQASAASSASSQVTAQSQVGVIQASVRLRDKPSLSSNVLAYLKSGENVQILEKSTAYYYKVKTSSGKIGYTSSRDQYIAVKNVSESVSKPGKEPSVPAPSTPSTTNVKIEKVIQTGMKYLGTPYEFGSDRNTTTTFDCSDFTRQIFKEAAGIVLPADSRQQGTWIKQNSKAVNNADQLKRGDLVFFMSYKGSSASAYTGIDKSKQTITHVAVYLGDGKLLHTYSKESGGVTVTDFSNAWKYRFLYGGSVIK